MEAIGTVLDVLLVVAAFGFIIFVHELGHFVAAKWAGIRVLGFALGFGPAIVSFRKGFGLTLGSSSGRYDTLVRARGALGEPPPEGVSPTEYRLNWVPLGGYVKMLGQEDDNPAARSDAPDSYNRCKPWKRMIVISAGVIMNLITAAIIFVIVFMVGLRTEPAVIGEVLPGSAAATATFAGSHPGVTEPGLRPGDLIESVDGDQIGSRKDLQVASAMSRKGRELEVVVRRPGINEPLRFSVTPREDPVTRLLSFGVGPASSGTLLEAKPAVRAAFMAQLAQMGLAGVEPGARLVRVGGLSAEAPTPIELARAAKESEGAPFEVELENPSGGRVVATLKPIPLLQPQRFADKSQPGTAVGAEHLAGLMPLMIVDQAAPDSGAFAAGLRAGDVFLAIGDVQYPTLLQGIAEVRRHAGRKVAVRVLRSGAPVDLPEVPVNRQGQIGFTAGTTAQTLAMVGAWPAPNRYHAMSESESIEAALDRPPAAAPSGATLGVPAGSRIASVAGVAVANLLDVRKVLRDLARATPTGPLTVTLRVTPPTMGSADAEAYQAVWTISESEAASLRELSWDSPVGAWYFKPQQILLQASDPWDALKWGVHETHRMMLQTYLTFARLLQGSMKVEHLKGPVGIAHTGTILVERGFIWLLFFMGVISVNLAVINFLPLPIVDGGHFVFLLYEQFTGRPVSANVQGVATLIGLALIGTMFVVVTYNDLANLLWR